MSLAPYVPLAIDPDCVSFSIFWCHSGFIVSISTERVSLSHTHIYALKNEHTYTLNPNTNTHACIHTRSVAAASGISSWASGGVDAGDVAADVGVDTGDAVAEIGVDTGDVVADVGVDT